MNDPFGINGTIQARVFRVEGAVAEGGFGVVYRAFHEVFRSNVALKCLKVPDTLTKEQRPAFLERFRSEAELLFRLSAALPEVVRPLQFGLLETQSFVPFLALEWLEGETLDGFVAKRVEAGKPPVGVSQALDLLTPVARVLSRAHHFHDQGETIAIIHADMKPENVFLANVHGERVVKVLDFGIARVKAETSAIAGRATNASGSNAFSPAYAAPEQWHPASFGGIGPWTDVYSLALTLCELLIGKPPIFGDMTSMMGAALAPDWRPTPRNKGAQVPDAIEKAFERALAVDPRARTQSVEAFWTQLELAANRAPSLTRKAAVSGSVPPPPNLELELPVSAPAPREATPAPVSGSIALTPMASPGMQEAFSDQSGTSVGYDLAGGGALDLDIAPQRAPRPRPSAASRAQTSAVWVPPAPSKSMSERFKGPAWLAFLAVAIGAADLVMTRMTGERLMLGPLKPMYVAGPIGLIALVLALWRALED